MARRLEFGGFIVRDTTTPILIRYLERRLSIGRPSLALGFANHNFVVACRPLVATTRPRRDVLLVNDGVGLQIAALLKYGRGFRENMNGTDFIPRFLRDARTDLRVYFLGGSPEAVAKAADTIGSLPGRKVVGQCDGYSLWDREAAVVNAINDARPNVLLVGLGNPRQEQWILNHKDVLNADLIFAVGALFDWIGQTRRRAPVFIRRARLEWMYRLMLEPRRLLKRYTIDVAVFFWLVLVRHR